MEKAVVVVAVVVAAIVVVAVPRGHISMKTPAPSQSDLKKKT